MIDFRRIVDDDINVVVDYVLHLLRMLPEKPMHISPDKVRAAVCHFAREPRDFNLIAVQDGHIVGAIAAFVAEMPWHERCEAHVAICWATVPGAGRRLLHELLDWARADMRIRRVVWAHNDGADLRVLKLAERMGFALQAMSVYQKG